MNFRDKKEIPSKYIYLFLAIICFILLFLSIIFDNRFSPLKTITSTIIVPMQSGVNKVGTTIFNQVVDSRSKDELLEENKKLKEKVEEYTSQIKIYEQESYELKRLQEILALKEQYIQYNTIGARVIATDSTNWFYTFVINKGEQDGVKVGCNILAGNGLAGIVTEVGQNYAKVRAIIDDNSNVSACISGTETLCTVSGDLSHMKDGYINVGYINKASTIEEGAELVTSHVSDKFLPGLLIGYIAEVELDANNLTKSAKCIPVVDFTNLQEVLVILDMKEDIKTNTTNKNIYDNIINSDYEGVNNATETTETTTQSEESATNNPETETTQPTTDTPEAETEAPQPVAGDPETEAAQPTTDTPETQTETTQPTSDNSDTTTENPESQESTD